MLRVIKDTKYYKKQRSSCIRHGVCSGHRNAHTELLLATGILCRLQSFFVLDVQLQPTYHDIVALQSGYRELKCLKQPHLQ